MYTERWHRASLANHVFYVGGEDFGVELIAGRIPLVECSVGFGYSDHLYVSAFQSLVQKPAYMPMDESDDSDAKFVVRPVAKAGNKQQQTKTKARIILHFKLNRPPPSIRTGAGARIGAFGPTNVGQIAKILYSEAGYVEAGEFFGNMTFEVLQIPS